MHGIFFNPPLETNFLGHQFTEIYKDRVYAPFLEGKKDLTILDIGANLGVTSYYFSQFAKQVYAVEASKQHFDILKHMVDFNKLTNVKPINKAIFIENGKFPFGGPKGNSTMRSLHAATWEGGQSDEEVTTVTLDKLFEDEKIEHVDFMKLDCEGSEVEILSSEGFSKVSKKIDLIIGEQHAWSGRHPNQIIDALKSNGFTYETIVNDANIFVARR